MTFGKAGPIYSRSVASKAHVYTAVMALRCWLFFEGILNVTLFEDKFHVQTHERKSCTCIWVCANTYILHYSFCHALYFVETMYI